MTESDASADRGGSESLAPPPDTEAGGRRKSVAEWIAIAVAAIALINALFAGRPASAVAVTTLLVGAGPAWLLRNRLRRISTGRRRDRLIRSSALLLALIVGLGLVIPASRDVMIHKVLGFPGPSVEIDQLTPVAAGGNNATRNMSSLFAVVRSSSKKPGLITHIDVNFYRYGVACENADQYVTYNVDVQADAVVNGATPLTGFAQQEIVGSESAMPLLRLPARVWVEGSRCHGWQVHVSMVTSLPIPAGTSAHIMIVIADDVFDGVQESIDQKGPAIKLTLADGSVIRAGDPNIF